MTRGYAIRCRYRADSARVNAKTKRGDFGICGRSLPPLLISQCDSPDGQL